MPSQLPEDLSLWSWHTLVDLIERHEFEPGQFDYKAQLNHRGPGSESLLTSIRKTACSLANTLGGWIIFGVEDRAKRVENPVDRIVGIPSGGDLRKEFGDKMQGIIPDLSFETSPRPIVLPTAADRGVFVVRIPVSPRRPHQVRETGAFYKRGDGGAAVAMDVYEVRDQIIATEERWRKLRLLRLELAQYRDQARTIAHSEQPGSLYVRFDVTTLKALLIEVLALLPSSEDFMPKILPLASRASEFNQILDQARAFGTGLRQAPESHLALRQEIRSFASRFEELCTTADGALDRRFARSRVYGAFLAVADTRTGSQPTNASSSVSSTAPS